MSYRKIRMHFGKWKTLFLVMGKNCAFKSHDMRRMEMEDM